MSEHNYNFESGNILRRIGVAWFVAYAYHVYVKPTYMVWNCDIKSLTLRKSNFIGSKKHHKFWLQQVLNMMQLDKHKNRVGLTSNEIKTLASDILKIL